MGTQTDKEKNEHHPVVCEQVQCLSNLQVHPAFRAPEHRDDLVSGAIADDCAGCLVPAASILGVNPHILPDIVQGARKL